MFDLATKATALLLSMDDDKKVYSAIAIDTDFFHCAFVNPCIDTEFFHCALVNPCAM